MKLLFQLVFVGICFFAAAGTALAHSSGVPPFFKINGKIPPSHPLVKEMIIPSRLSVAQDLPEENYLVNQPLTFVIDTNLLGQVYPEETLKKITYKWAFGDGTSGAVGVTNKHSFAKVGSYIVSIYADFKDPQIPPQLIESAQLNIVPQKNYQLPKPEIVINHAKVSGKTESVNLHQQQVFEAALSNTPTADVVSYQWDFGDGKIRSEKILSYAFPSTYVVATPVLRITDKNGLFSDTFILLTNKTTPTGITIPTDKAGIIIGIVQLVILVVGGIYFLSVMRNHRKRAKK